MNELSSRSYEVLTTLDQPEVIPSDGLCEEEAEIAQQLAKKGYLEVHILVLPGQEEAFYGCHGLVGYRTNAAGREALRLRKDHLHSLDQKAKQHSKERAQDRRRSWWQFWLGLFIGWVLGGITFQEVISLLIAWFKSF